MKTIKTEFPDFKICHLLQPRIDNAGDNFEQFLYKISQCSLFDQDVYDLGYEVCMDYLLALTAKDLFDFIVEAYPNNKKHERNI